MRTLKNLLYIDDTHEALFLVRLLSTVIETGPPASEGTETSFISFWDTNIGNVMHVSLGDSTRIRDSNHHTSTNLQRPDFGLLLRNTCLFRGEEKSSVYSGVHPREELSSKLVWKYDPAEYILGYYAIGTDVTYFAITPNRVVDLKTFHLSLKTHRVHNLAFLVRLLRILSSLSNIFPEEGTAKFVILRREEGLKRVHIGGKMIQKDYLGPDRAFRVRRLQAIYALLREKNVPYTDKLIRSFVEDPEYGSCFYTAPVGIPRFPRSQTEMVRAIKCVLEALKVLPRDWCEINHPYFDIGLTRGEFRPGTWRPGNMRCRRYMIPSSSLNPVLCESLFPLPASRDFSTVSRMSVAAHDNSFKDCRDVLCNNTTHYHYSSPAEALLHIMQSHANNNAVYNSAERQTEEASTCQEKTRESILTKMDRWVGGEGPRIAWLYGPAGSGKTTIAHTVAKRCDEDKMLAFSYFFSRRNTDRSDWKKFVPTFAYQLVRMVSPLNPLIKSALDSDPDIFKRSLEDQLRTLIVGPVSEISKKQQPPNPLTPMIIVVDGLDEYSEDDGGVSLASLITTLVEALSGMPFRLLFTSRPEPYIRALFVDNPSIKAEAKEIPLRDMETRNDVYKYLAEELEKVRRRKRIEQQWPNKDELWALADKSEGIFTYASTLVRFVGDKQANSLERLKAALVSHEGLDSLFAHVLDSAKMHDNFWEVFDVVIFLKARLSIRNVAMLLQHETNYVRSALEGCQSILVVPDDDSDYIRPYHASLLDFLNDPSRFREHFHGPASSHATLLDVCSRRISNDEKLSSPLDDNLFYAYRNWYHHLISALSNENATNDNRPLRQKPENDLFKSLLQEPMIWLCRMYSPTEVKEWLAELEEVIKRAKEKSDYVSYSTKLRKRVQKFVKNFNKNYGEGEAYKKRIGYADIYMYGRRYITEEKYYYKGYYSGYGYEEEFGYGGELNWPGVCNQICSKQQDYRKIREGFGLLHNLVSHLPIKARINR